ncbi:hypothetical protein COOONC_22469 [Cooperia oncophora]
MFLLLYLVFLITYGGSVEERSSLDDYIYDQFNGYRQSIANGTAYKLGGYLPGSLSLFTLVRRYIESFKVYCA